MLYTITRYKCVAFIKRNNDEHCLPYLNFAIEILLGNIDNVCSAKSIVRFIGRWHGLRRALTKIQYRKCQETSDTSDLQCSCK